MAATPNFEWPPFWQFLEIKKSVQRFSPDPIGLPTYQISLKSVENCRRSRLFSDFAGLPNIWQHCNMHNDTTQQLGKFNLEIYVEFTLLILFCYLRCVLFRICCQREETFSEFQLLPPLNNINLPLPIRIHICYLRGDANQGLIHGLNIGGVKLDLTGAPQ